MMTASVKLTPKTDDNCYFRTSEDHLMAELERIDLMIRALVTKASHVYVSDSQFQGLLISEQEINQLLAQPAGFPHWTTTHIAFNKTDTDPSIEQIKTNIRQRIKESRKKGIELRISQLSDCFHLGPIEVDILLICLAGELDPRYQKMFAYLQDDVTKKHPSIDLILNILSGSFREKLKARKHFFPGAPLMRFKLLERFEDSNINKCIFLNHYLKMDNRIINYLLGLDEIDDHLQGLASVKPCNNLFNPALIDGEIGNRLKKLAAYTRTSNQLVVLNFVGDGIIEKKACAELFCHTANTELIMFDIKQWLTKAHPDLETVLIFLGREAMLCNGSIFIKNIELFENDEHHSKILLLMENIRQWKSHVFLSTQHPMETGSFFLKKKFFQIQLQPLSYEKKINWWQHAFSLSDLQVNHQELKSIAAAFNFTADRILESAQTAEHLAMWKTPDGSQVTKEDLYAACRMKSNQTLSKIAEKILPFRTWTDLVLPGEKLVQLKEICSIIKFRPLVYEEWGFGSKFSTGKGLNVLFCGSSGTGKTLAAEIIANEMGLDLYKIDLSMLVSKYIGETEKNLSQIFAEAHTANAILFFDEADALFGKRSEVRDSHDRYANIQVSYLLQKIEAYEGVAILATNFRKNMDEAFVRRIHYKVEFPFPDEHDRANIWNTTWPATVPLGPSADLDKLAKHFEISGGNIRNIALSSAFLAANDGGKVEMDHLLRATKQEFQKIGRIMVDKQFKTLDA